MAELIMENIQTPGRKRRNLHLSEMGRKSRRRASKQRSRTKGSG
jgi:hypothetical protein